MWKRGVVWCGVVWCGVLCCTYLFIKNNNNKNKCRRHYLMAKVYCMIINKTKNDNQNRRENKDLRT